MARSFFDFLRNTAKRFSSNKRRKSVRLPRRKLRCELLESRQMLTVVTIDAVGATTGFDITVDGVQQADVTVPVSLSGASTNSVSGLGVGQPGPGSDADWTLNGADIVYTDFGSGNTITFTIASGRTTLNGGGGNDAYTLAASTTANIVDTGGGDNTYNLSANTLTGSILGSTKGGGGPGGAGTDTLTVAGDVTLTVSTADGFAGTNAIIRGGFSNVTSVVSSNAAHLIGENAAATWNLQAAGTYVDANSNSLAFSGFATVVGGSGDDTYNYDTTANKAFSIADPAGINTLQGTQITDVALTGSGIGSTGYNGTDGFTFIGMTNIVGVGTGTLSGENDFSIWTLGTTNTYNDFKGNGDLTFSGFAVADGNNSGNIFNVDVSSTISIVGGLGSDTLQGIAITDVALTSSDASGFGFTGTTGTESFANIDKVVGTGTLTGESTGGTWNVTLGTYVDATAHTLQESGFSVLAAGSLASDSFKIDVTAGKNLPSSLTTLFGNKAGKMELLGGGQDGIYAPDGATDYAGTLEIGKPTIADGIQSLSFSNFQSIDIHNMGTMTVQTQAGDGTVYVQDGIDQTLSHTIPALIVSAPFVLTGTPFAPAAFWNLKRLIVDTRNNAGTITNPSTGNVFLYNVTASTPASGVANSVVRGRIGLTPGAKQAAAIVTPTTANVANLAINTQAVGGVGDNVFIAANVTVSGNLDIDSDGTIIESQTVSINIGGSASFDAPGQSITLTGANNQFAVANILHAATASLTSISDMQLGTINVTGTFNPLSNSGFINQASNSIVTVGKVNFGFLSSESGNVNLPNQTNQIGEVLPTTLQNLSLGQAQTKPLILDAITVVGDMHLATPPKGSISQSAGIAVGHQLFLGGGGGFGLSNSANQISLTSTTDGTYVQDLYLTNNSAVTMNLDTLNVHGDLHLDAGAGRGNISQNADAAHAIAEGHILEVKALTVGLSNAANNFTTVTVPGVGFVRDMYLYDANDVAFGTALVLGDLHIFAGGGVSQSSTTGLVVGHLLEFAATNDVALTSKLNALVSASGLCNNLALTVAGGLYQYNGTFIDATGTITLNVGAAGLGSSTTLAGSIQTTSASQITVNGGAGSDGLTVDLDTAAFSTTASVQSLVPLLFNGGDTASTNTLTVLGKTVSSSSTNYFAVHENSNSTTDPGVIASTLASAPLNYANIQSLDIEGRGNGSNFLDYHVAAGGGAVNHVKYDSGSISGRMAIYANPNLANNIIGVTDTNNLPHGTPPATTATVPVTIQQAFGGGSTTVNVPVPLRFSVNAHDMALLQMFGSDGNDTLVNKTDIDALLDGGAGNDTLVSGIGDIDNAYANEILLGGSGADTLIAKGGRNLLMGDYQRGLDSNGRGTLVASSAPTGGNQLSSVPSYSAFYVGGAGDSVSGSHGTIYGTGLSLSGDATNSTNANQSVPTLSDLAKAGINPEVFQFVSADPF